MVEISAPSMVLIGVTQERTASPLTCTVQAPHCAIPQPNLVPVKPTSSRNTQRSGISPSTSSRCEVPLTLIVTMVQFRCAEAQGQPAGAEPDCPPLEASPLGWGIPLMP